MALQVKKQMDTINLAVDILSSLETRIGSWQQMMVTKDNRKQDRDVSLGETTEEDSLE